MELQIFITERVPDISSAVASLAVHYAPTYSRGVIATACAVNGGWKSPDVVNLKLAPLLLISGTRSVALKGFPVSDASSHPFSCSLEKSIQ